MLETIREYAFERLEESGELDDARRKHVDFFLELAERERDVMQASTSLERLATEHDNFRIALQHARELCDAASELRLVSALAQFWEVRGHLNEGLEAIRQALDRDPSAPSETRGRALYSATMIAAKQGDWETARRLAEEKKELHLATEDELGVGQSLHLLGVIAMAEGRFDEARDLLEEGKAIHDRFGYLSGLNGSLHVLGLLAMDQRDYARARAELEAGLAIAEQVGSERWTANGLCDLGFAELGDGRLDHADERLRAGLAAAASLDWRENVAYCLVGLGRIACARGELDRAARFLGQVDRLAEDIHLNFEIYAKRERAQLERELRTRLGGDRLDALRTEGQALSMGAAVAEALTALD